nr:retrovirus-related Pol polyprotein from transposon TNT 1-94 [Tanacetum cinerariifolium]
MACSLSHTVDEINALVQKLIHEDSVRQKAMMDLAVQFDNASAAKHDLRKAYEKCNDIPQETHIRHPIQNVHRYSPTPYLLDYISQSMEPLKHSTSIHSIKRAIKWASLSKAEAIATTCFTQNHSIIHRRFNKTPYELINSRKPDISFLYVFGALCYPKNDLEDIRKLGAKGELDLLFEAMYDDFIGGQPSAAQRTVPAAQA